jgi:hypothetical protein
VLHRAESTDEKLAPAATPKATRVPVIVVNKDRMTTGRSRPWAAAADCQSRVRQRRLLRDELSGQVHAIKEWEEFAPFASSRSFTGSSPQRQVSLREGGKGRRFKSVIGVAVVGAIAAGGVLWYLEVRGAKRRARCCRRSSLAGLDVGGGSRPETGAQSDGGWGGAAGRGMSTGGLATMQEVSAARRRRPMASSPCRCAAPVRRFTVPPDR